MGQGRTRGECRHFSDVSVSLTTSQATRDHLAISRRDLTSKEVYEIIFEKTRPGALVGDEASGEGGDMNIASEGVGDAAM
jgi:hypothetical protein